jgi:hypothetical protein
MAKGNDEKEENLLRQQQHLGLEVEEVEMVGEVERCWVDKRRRGLKEDSSG